MKISHSTYLSSVFNPKILKKTVDKTNDDLLKIKKKYEFDAIAFTGNSGAGICYPLSYMYKWDIICVRKDESNSHGTKIEGAYKDINKYIIVDDFICSGSTIKRIKEKLNPLECIGIYTYFNENFRTDMEFNKE